jgi:TRAP-type C4-dicarboxylate transport system permease small subunit
MTIQPDRLDITIPSRSLFWHGVESLMILAFVGMLCVMFVQVFARYALAIAVPWTDETSRFLYIAQIFLGMGIAQRYGQHIRITVVLDLMGQKLRNRIEILADVLTALIGVAIVFGAFQMFFKSGNAMASTLPLRMSSIYAVQFMGLFLYVMLILKSIWDKLYAPLIMESDA